MALPIHDNDVSRQAKSTLWIFEGRALVYISDVEYTKGEPAPELVAFAKDAQLLVHEAYFTDDERRAATDGRGLDPLATVDDADHVPEIKPGHVVV